MQLPTCGKVSDHPRRLFVSHPTGSQQRPNGLSEAPVGVVLTEEF